MERYQRQIILPGIGTSGQQKLKSSSVLVVGAGGLGCAVLPYLVTAGVGRIGIVDGDRVEESNLHRQVLYQENSIGSLKVESAQKALLGLNSTTQFEIVPEFLSEENVDSLLESYDLVIDATDTIEVRYTLDAACIRHSKPMIYGSIFRFQGQVSVFNFQGGPSYISLFPQEDKVVLNCEEAGVLGTTVGMIGMIQANEALKIILGIGEVLSGKILVYNMLTNDQQIFHLADEPIRDAKNTASAQVVLTDPELILIQEGLLLDVREAGEQPEIPSGFCLNIPLSELESRLSELNKESEITLFCQAGGRAIQAGRLLQKAGFNKIRAVRGGAKDILKLIEYEKSIS
ncbi:HesA/MoeB/ThiF family protein [Algoriphagus winogradskyi]|uniref:Adenylyltransferase and sulfurtransferase n=1 Tax=Algoriphagus winogradskyi TaxID=237017 RepID=A0ABY1NNR0_9BACT|nr:HesA/MoeB/ThiF family protein [Algoriphagus winogradskyi]SMP14194.1 adenylyltransferase and sulfurtransferase [Algoriphagus winogradskyi]